MSAVMTDWDWRSALADIAPVLRADGAAGEAGRRLPDTSMKALVDSGFLRAWTPRALGGWELSAGEGVRLFEAVARVDSSAGWIVANCCAIVTASQSLPDESAAEILRDPAAVIVGGLFPPGVAVPVDDGYMISGRWSFVSGCHYGTWQLGAAIILDSDGNPTVAPNGDPALVVFWADGAAGTIVDNWDTLGMRGTGSHDVELNDVFVPHGRTVPFGPIHPGSAFRGPLYAFHNWVAGIEVAAVALGIGDAALGAAIGLASRKTPNFTASAIAERPVAQDRLARARANLDAGRAYLHSAIEDLHVHLDGGGALSPEVALPVQLASCQAVEAASQTVDDVSRVVGSSTFRAGEGFERHVRDINTIARHAFASDARFESAGKILLGQPTDWPFLLQ